MAYTTTTTPMVFNKLILVDFKKREQRKDWLNDSTNTNKAKQNKTNKTKTKQQDKDANRKGAQKVPVSQNPQDVFFSELTSCNYWVALQDLILVSCNFFAHVI